MAFTVQGVWGGRERQSYIGISHGGQWCERGISSTTHGGETGDASSQSVLLADMSRLGLNGLTMIRMATKTRPNCPLGIDSSRIMEMAQRLRQGPRPSHFVGGFSR
jgi:hypothetical protein